MTIISVISLILSAFSFCISVPLGISQIFQIRRGKPNVICEIDASRTAYIKPIYTNSGNQCSLLVALRLVNKSSSPIEISSINIEIGKYHWESIKNNQAVDYKFDNYYLDIVETLEMKDVGINLPFRMEPFSSKSGYIIFPYADNHEDAIVMNVVTPFLTFTQNVEIEEQAAMK